MFLLNGLLRVLLNMSREHREPNPLSSRRVCWYMNRVGVFVNLSGTAVRRTFTVSNLEYSRSEAAFLLSSRCIIHTIDNKSHHPKNSCLTETKQTGGQFHEKIYQNFTHNNFTRSSNYA